MYFVFNFTGNLGFSWSKAKFGVMWLTVLAVAAGTVLPVAATAAGNDRSEGVPAFVLPFPELRFDRPGAATAQARPLMEQAADYVSKNQLAQFSVPQFSVPMEPRKGTTPGKREAERRQLSDVLKFQYAIGSDSELTYNKNLDLNSKVRDDVMIFAPTLFGLFTYRPYAWLETTLELTAERQIELQEENIVVLPDGSVTLKEKKRLSLLVDQANVKFKKLGPFAITVGRRTYEDERLWLYDGALDGFHVDYKQGDFHAEASVTQENYFNGELLFHTLRTNVTNYIFYLEYRGIEDNKLAAYAIQRNDLRGLEKPQNFGVRMYGNPTDRFNYWIELAMIRGQDEDSNDFKGQAFDVGAQYRFLDLPLQPSVTLGYAFGSGDRDPNDKTNHEFRQTGLQSNEGRFNGVTQFKYYGEMLGPELTNLRILTAGVGFRPAKNAFLDLVYHNYKLVENAQGALFSSAVTAELNQDPMHQSKDVGNEIDIILGFRNLFGFRTFGFEVRAGKFFPGKAYRNPEGDPDAPTFRGADDAYSVLAVIIL
jgi:alginate production protein